MGSLESSSARRTFSSGCLAGIHGPLAVASLKEHPLIGGDLNLP